MRAIGRFASLAWLLLAAATSAHADQAQDVLARVRAQVVTVAALNSRAQVDSEGSGVVVHAGRVVTNCHVVAEAHSLRLTLADGRQLVATRLREDPVRDLCLLEVRELTVAGVARRALADVGQGEAGFAVGNPLGLGLAVSAGVVSAIDRRGAEPRIITSAAVSPGSSGGGLFDGAGRLLGITSSVLELGQNVSVAIPADAIARLERDGRPPVMPAPVTPEPDWLAVAEDLRLRADWTGLLAHAERWQQVYPTSADALASAGLAEGNLGRLAAARERLVRGAATAPWHALTSGYLARTYLALGDYAAAEAEARRATRLQPSGGYYWGLLGDALRGLARPDEAAIAYATALRFSPGQASVWEGWGDLAAAAGKGDEAAERYRVAVRLAPNADGLRRKLAQALALRGEGAAAGRELAAVKDSGKADDAKAWNNVGTGEEKAGRYREAEQAYRKALAIDPRLPEAWHNLGLVLRRSGRDDEAAKAFERAVELNPRATGATIMLAELRQRAGRTAEAAELAARACEAPDAQVAACRLLGSIASERREWERAESAYARATQLDGKLADDWVALGQARVQRGKAAEAAEALQRALAINPSQGTAYQALSALHGRRGDYTKALEYGERATQLEPTDYQAWSNKGYSLLKLQRPGEAVPAFETALRLKPDFANAWINLGEAKIAQRQMGEAIAALRKALELSPGASDARLYLTSAYIGAGQFALAREQATLLAEKLPQVPQVWYLMAVANAGLGDREAAIAAHARLKSLNPAAASELRARLAALLGSQAMPLPE